MKGATYIDTKKGSAVERAFLVELMGGTKFST